jgi:asparagine synthase (glutamine-hydrolysing)
MCGICGIANLSNQPLSASIQPILERMNTALTHRGPDSAGLWQNDKVALGHRRLAIMDVSDAGIQPMPSADTQAMLVFNGEIYNYQDLKKQTPQYPYRSHSDSEVLLAAYQQKGKKMLPDLNGMFAFAIWDNIEQSLLIARDPMGIKPLYYAIVDNFLVFASEIRAILASGLVERQLNNLALGSYLRYQTVYAPHTLIENIKVLPAGHALTVKDGAIKIEAFYDSTTALPPLSISDKKQLTDPVFTKKMVRETLRAAVGRQMMSDVPFGAFLSGGVDSSVIVALMRDITEGSIETFSVTFDDKKFDETPYARAIADRFKTNHHEIHLKANDFLSELPRALNALDHPSGDAVNTYIVAQATRRSGIKMALSGLGGDELFGGYPIFKQSEQLEKLRFLNLIPQILRKSAGSIIEKMTPSVSRQKMAAVLALPEVSPMAAYDYFREVFTDQQRRTILKNGYAQAEGLNLHKSLTINQLPLYSQVSIAEMTGYMQNVLLRDSDQMSMAHALELRVPLLDIELVNLALHIPDALKRGAGSKPLLVDSMSDLLPKSLFDRPKMGFTLPFEAWMRHELRDFCSQRLAILSHYSAFNADTIQSLWQDFLAGRNDIRWSRLWTLVALGHWLERHGIQRNA